MLSTYTCRPTLRLNDSKSCRTVHFTCAYCVFKRNVQQNKIDSVDEFTLNYYQVYILSEFQLSTCQQRNEQHANAFSKPKGIVHNYRPCRTHKSIHFARDDYLTTSYYVFSNSLKVSSNYIKLCEI